MKTIKLLVQLEYNEEVMHSADKDDGSYEWFIDEVLVNPKEGEQLILHSNCIGDEVGQIKVIGVIKDI